MFADKKTKSWLGGGLAVVGLAWLATRVIGSCALVYGAETGNHSLVQLGLRLGLSADVRDEGWTPLMYAAMHGHVNAARPLLASGADTNARNDGGSTPLMIAATHGRAELVKLLIASRAEVNALHPDGSAALDRAVVNGNLEVVRILVANGADVNRDEVRAALTRTRKNKPAILRVLASKQ